MVAQNLEDQITLLRHEIAQYKSIIKEMSVPLIESSLNNTLLMPLSGHLFQERITQIEVKLFNHLQGTLSCKNRHYGLYRNFAQKYDYDVD